MWVEIDPMLKNNPIGLCYFFYFFIFDALLKSKVSLKDADAETKFGKNAFLVINKTSMIEIGRF
jgi:hypothetical protein